MASEALSSARVIQRSFIDVREGDGFCFNTSQVHKITSSLISNKRRG